MLSGLGATHRAGCLFSHHTSCRSMEMTRANLLPGCPVRQARPSPAQDAGDLSMKDQADSIEQKKAAAEASRGRSTLPPALVEQLLNSMDVRIEAFALCRVARDSALV